MDSVLITGLMTVLGGVITYILGHMAGRKKRAVDVAKVSEETEALRIENLKSTINIYKIVHDELSGQLKILSAKCHDLSLEIHQLRNENISLKEEIIKLNQRLQS